MGIWRGLRVAFIAGSLLMILLIILYWDDVGGFNLYPRQDLKHDPMRDPVDLYPHSRTTPGPLHPVLTSTAAHDSLLSVPTIRTSTPHSSSEQGRRREDEEERGKEVEKYIGEERKDIEGERRGEEEEGEGESRRAEEERRRQEVRKHTVMDICSGKDSVKFPGKSRTFEQIPNRELDHLIVDDTHQIIYCYVPKVACTNWKRVMVVLSQSLVSPSSGKPYTDPEAVPPDLVHNASLHLTFAKFWRHYGSLSRHLMAVKLQRYTKFLFVRDPFVRLISAFRNKFGRPNEDFYRQFGSVMLRRHGNMSQGLPDTAAEAFAAGIRPTFQQFIKYLLDPETEREAIFNEHWRQVYRLCHPCQVQYDFIGRLETLETDSEQLLRILGVDHMLRFPTGARNRTAASWEDDWFAQIPMAMRRELYRLYEPDFELFGYPKPDTVLDL